MAICSVCGQDIPDQRHLETCQYSRPDPIQQAGTRSNSDLNRLPPGAENDPTVREVFASRRRALSSDPNLLSNAVARRAGIQLPDTAGDVQVERARADREHRRRRGALMTSPKTEAENQENLLKAVQDQLLDLAKSVSDGKTDPQHVLTSIRQMKKDRVSRVKSVRSLVGVDQDEKYRSVESLFKEVRESYNEFLTKYAIFVSVEGQPEDNMPQFVLRFVRPASRGYAETMNPASFTGGSGMEGKTFVIAEHKTTRIDHSLKELETFFKWILKRWEKKP